MLTVADYELIRRSFFIDGQSARAIAKQLGHSRKTVAKAIANAVPPGYRLSQFRLRPAIERYRTIIDAWLEQDQSRPRKQRHTAQRIDERLRDEHGYAGSASSVRRYVAWRKRGQGEVFLPLYFGPGEEAQVDWGEATVIHRGVERKVQLFCMKLCHSHAVFVWAYERANLESFLDGHVRAFAFFGGVPKRIAYDNLKSAVVWVGRGRERRLNRRFLELRSWYLFDSRFCNVAKGNEKGHVENLVKRSQRTFLTPLPEIEDLDTLNAKLLQDCLAELERTDAQGQSYRTLWELEYRSGDEGTRQFIRILLLMTKHPEAEVRQAVGVCVQRRAFSVEAVVAAMRNEPLCAPVRRLDLAHRPELAGVGEGIRPASLYDALAHEGEEVAA
jgi:transposase